jgi:xylitol oxidase
MTDVIAEQRTNWAGNVTYRASALLRPTSVGEVQDLVTSTPRLTALGSTHSFNEVADTDAVQLTLTEMPPSLEIDTARRTVRVAAGMTHAQVAAGLEARGWALGNLASLPHISTAGAVATGTHGSGVRNPSLAQAVVGLDVVRASGELEHVSAESAAGSAPAGGPASSDLLDAHRVALGALGVVTALELAIEPTFEVATTVHLDLPWDAVEEHFDAVMADAYSVSMFTAFDDRGARQVWTKHRVDEPAPVFDLVELGARRATEAVHPGENDAASVTEQGGVPGPWSERLPHFRSTFSPSTGAEIQAEYLIPAAFAVPALRALRPLADLFAPLLIAAEVRTIAADTAWLAPSSGRQSVGLHFTFRRDASAVAAAVLRIEDVLAPFDPRPHWGKVSAASPARLHEAYPQLAAFAELARSLDPEGRFRNGFLERTLG